MTASSPNSSLDLFGPATRRWFEEAFQEPTPVQERGWRSIACGGHSLLTAPTGSGKTLAAFLYAIDRVASLPDTAVPGVRVLYISPLKALVYDIERNLRAPLAGITRAAEALGQPIRTPGIDIRTGDTSSTERQRQKRNPSEILVTTPESLFLILGSGARESLRTVQWIIVDEVHAMAGTKRGVHLALSLERLSALVASSSPDDKEPQRIGLSATVNPLKEVGRFLAGHRPVDIVDASVPPKLDLRIVVPVDDMTRPVIATADGPVLASEANEVRDPLLGATEAAQRHTGIWPALHPEILALIKAHKSTIVFVNSRGLCERLAQHLNDLAGEDLVKAHHGSIAHDQRRVIEEGLKAGTLQGIVATSSLELGIDMGAVDLVILVESPGRVSSGLQRIGRAGHGVGETSIGRVFPKHRGDLLEAAVVAKAMRKGEIEALRIPRNPLDVLAQHIVAMTGVQSWPVEDLAKLVRRSAPYANLPDSAFTGVLDMLSGLYPSHDFSDLRARIDWDRDSGVLTGRKGSRMLASVNAGTIPDRGLYGVFIGHDGPRVGELDEEMVHESASGQTFTLGASTWRIIEITRDRVIVEGAPGEPGRLPFWKGEGPGRPVELGRALGEFTRMLSTEAATDDVQGTSQRLSDEHGLDEKASINLLRYLAEQREATGVLPTDRDIVVERFRDELGDWRICILSPFGARLHAPWALVIRSAVTSEVGYDVQTVWSDDGIVLTLVDGDEPPRLDLLIPDPDDLEDRLLRELSRSPLFASQFRENAARALLLPRRRPGSRTPLFAQRLRAQKLMSVALNFPSFPIVIETYRSCLQDVFDVPGLTDLLRSIQTGHVKVHEVETPSASPFARSLVFAYVAAYLYEGDSPAAERRAQALSLDVGLLRELLGDAQLRELLDADVMATVEAELQATTKGFRVKDAAELHDLLRRIGDLSDSEIAERATEPLKTLLGDLETDRRAYRVRVGQRDTWIAREDVALYRDALGTAPPTGVPTAFLGPVEDPVAALLARWARTRGPFDLEAISNRFGLVPAQAAGSLEQLVVSGRLLTGEFRPGGSGIEWCDPDTLRRIKRRTLAHLRGQVEPMPREIMGRFLPKWHEVGTTRRSHQALEDAVARLEGLPLAHQELEASVFPARINGYRPEELDQLGAMGWLVWVGRGPLGADDGRVALYRREKVGRLLEPTPDPHTLKDLGEKHHAALDHLRARGASFFPALHSTLECTSKDMAEVIWDLVWAGLVTNDSMAGLRALRTLRRGRLKSRRRPTLVPGRWSLVSELVDATVTDTERAHARAVSLLERHGIVTREAAAIEGGTGGFSAIYRVFREMEATGRVRRGYFVEGLGGAQFALAGTVDRLRGMAKPTGEPAVHVLSATDPASPYGWMLPWPEYNHDGRRGPIRSSKANVVLVDGLPVLYLDRNGKRMRTMKEASPETLRHAFGALRQLATRLRRKSLRLEEIDGEAATASIHVAPLKSAGFVENYRGFSLDM